MKTQNASEVEDRPLTDDTVSIYDAAINYSLLRSVSVRLSRRWGIKPESARTELYSMDRGIRGRCIDALDLLADPESAMTWFAPVLEKFHRVMDSKAITPHDKTVADLAEQVALEDYRFQPTAPNRRKLYLATEKAAMAGLAYAATLRNEEEAERE